ncbi:porin family protein [Myxococcus stipitatus]|uniref:porin family protein n=1 Tax=Myxococcus stipitatus TaxID=83455 RepID=UPI0030CE5BA1
MKSRAPWMLCSLSFALAASPALADDRDDSDAEYSDEGSDTSERGGGFALGLRAGFGVPFGKISGDEAQEDRSKLADAFSGAIPFQVEAGYFFNPNVYLGAFFQYGILTLKPDCLEGVSCSASQLRVGINAAYHFQATRLLEPWVGLGVGYERSSQTSSLERSEDEVSATVSIQGLEFVSGQAGLDFRVSRRFSVGPYVTYTLAQYSSVTLTNTRGDAQIGETEDIDEKALHSWLYGGVRLQMRF